MISQRLALVAIAGLLVLAPPVAAEEDPFAEDEDPFDDEDPFAEYESQLADTVNATDAMADEDEGDDGASDEDADAGDDEAGSTDEETKDSPGVGLGLATAAGLAGALLANRER